MKQRPLAKYTVEDCANMPREQFDALLEEDNAWVREHYARLNEREQPRPKFNTIEEVMEYYYAKPMEEVLNNVSKLLGL